MGWRPGTISIRRSAPAVAFCLLTACAPEQPPAPSDTLEFGDGMVVPYGRIEPRDPRSDSGFVRIIASPILAAYGEPRLDPAMRENEVLRFTYLPSFDSNRVVRVLSRPDGCSIVAKAGTPKPWNGAARLAHRDSFGIEQALCRRLMSLADSLRLDDRGDSTRAGVDGSSWLFESVRGGRYRATTRWTPEPRGPDDRFIRVGRQLLDAARVTAEIQELQRRAPD